MLLTRDNVLKFVRQKKYVTPTHVAKEFEVVTTIASAALSELVKDLSLKLTYIKFGTTPYYYDPLQKDCLIEICEKSFSGNELNLFHKIKEQEIVSKNALTIPEQVIISKLRDIYYEISLEHNSKEYIFYIWYLRDKQETLAQIKTALKGDSKSKNSKSDTKNTSQNTEPKIEKKEIQNKEEKISKNPFENIYSKKESNSNESSIQNTTKKEVQIKSEVKEKQESSNSLKVAEKIELQTSQEVESNSVDSYLQSHNFKILEKEKHIIGSVYKTTLQVNGFSMLIDCMHIEQKKVQLKEIMEFYTSSMHPKYILYNSLPKKIEQVLEELGNCFLVKLKE